MEAIDVAVQPQRCTMDDWGFSAPRSVVKQRDQTLCGENQALAAIAARVPSVVWQGWPRGPRAEGGRCSDPR